MVIKLTNSGDVLYNPLHDGPDTPGLHAAQPVPRLHALAQQQGQVPGLHLHVPRVRLALKGN